MRKLEIHGTLCITDDLASRLQSRGLLSSSGKVTEEFILFIQECIARDDNRCSILADKNCSNNSLPSAEVVNEPVNNGGDSEQDFEQENAESETQISKPNALKNSLNSLVDESDLAALRQGLSTLYQGG